MLSNLPSYFFYVRTQEETKSLTDLDIWKRHTIEWDIRCEWEGYGREEAQKQAHIMFNVDFITNRHLLQETAQIAGLGVYYIGILGSIGFLTCGLLFICCISKDKPQVAFVQQYIATLVIKICWIIFAYRVSYRLQTLRESSLKNIEKQDAYRNFKFECTDIYTRVNTDLVLN